MTVKDLLILARAKIADVTHWCRGAYARDRDGYQVPPYSPYACQWCALGAVHAVAMETGYQRHAAAEALSESTDPLDTVAQFNDRCTHAEILALYDRAVATVENG